ncbi:hypothetical protein HHI36_013467, partial [Cryptolaemus montrouzieri]
IAITDKEGDPEDDLVTQVSPRDVLGTVEVVRRRKLSSDGDSSDSRDTSDIRLSPIAYRMCILVFGRRSLYVEKPLHGDKTKNTFC